MGAPPNDKQVTPLEGNANVDQTQAKPPTMTNAEMRAIIAQMAQDMTTQAQAVIVQAQAKIA